jgi:hypothetical protein
VLDARHIQQLYMAEADGTSTERRIGPRTIEVTVPPKLLLISLGPANDPRYGHVGLYNTCVKMHLLVVRRNLPQHCCRIYPTVNHV